MRLQEFYKLGMEMTKATNNRRLMPLTAQAVDWIRSEFPGVKVLYAREGDYVMGKDIDRSKLVKPCIQEGIPPKKGKKK